MADHRKAQEAEDEVQDDYAAYHAGDEITEGIQSSYVHRLLSPQGPTGASNAAASSIPPTAIQKKQDPGAGAASGNVSCPYGPWGCKLPGYPRATTFKQKVLPGSGVVSKRCKNSDKDACGDLLGCEWSDEGCVDASVWRCGTNKKILDCDSRYQLGPFNMMLPVDQLCGKKVLGQKKTTEQKCEFGLRHNFHCTKDEQCGPTDAPGKCINQRAYDGCIMKSFHPCTDLALEKVAVMAT